MSICLLSWYGGLLVLCPIFAFVFSVLTKLSILRCRKCRQILYNSIIISKGCQQRPTHKPIKITYLKYPVFSFRFNKWLWKSLSVGSDITAEVGIAREEIVDQLQTSIDIVFFSKNCVSSMTTLDASPNILLIAVIFSNIDFKVNTIAGM
jgi:hypothetical protein